MTVLECEVPACSALDRGLVETAYFKDSYRAPLSRSSIAVVDIFHAIFGHHPMGMKFALIVRNSVVRWFGLDAPAASEILRPAFKDSYAVGDKIGVWPILSMTENELVVGRDNKHLDFKLSVLKMTEGETASVAVSTICTVHNAFGKIYLYFVVPFHKWGVKRIISNAVIAKRL